MYEMIVGYPPFVDEDPPWTQQGFFMQTVDVGCVSKSLRHFIKDTYVICS